MLSFRFRHVCLEGWADFSAPLEVTSAELEQRLEPLYRRLGIPFGTLERLSGVEARRFFPLDVLPSQIGTQAAERALDHSGIDRSQIGAVFNCSVTRDYFEPSTGSIIHRNLGLREAALAFDVSNACLGFTNGLVLLGNLIESGIVQAGIVVSGETISRMVENNIRQLLDDPTLGRDDLLRLLPTLTLGSGGAAYVLCHESLSQRGHHILGGAARSATEHIDLCAGNADHCAFDNARDSALMRTESSQIVAAAAQLGARLWPECSQVLGWNRDDVDRILCHQIGRQVNAAFYEQMGLDVAKEFTIYRRLGNLVSAALPTAFCHSIADREPARKERILCTAFGSGLNAVFYGSEW